ncbi:MAG: hypothetical protein WCD79_01580 [Chthoniobacteraceae bacterium]
MSAYALINFFKVMRGMFIALVCLALLIALIVAEENWRGKRAWEECRHDLEAQGEHLDLAYFIPPPVPDDQNFALTPLLKPLLDYARDPATHKAIYREPDPPVKKIQIFVEDSKATKPKSPGWMFGCRKDLKTWQTYYRASLPDMTHPQSAADDVLAVLGRFNPQIAELRDAATTHPLSRFPLKYEEGLSMELPHYTAIQAVTSFIALRATAELDLKHSDDAFADVQFGFRLVESIQGEPLLISGLVRIAMMAVLMQPIWEGIATHQWTDSQLGWLQKRTGRADFLSDYSLAMRAERGSANWMWDELRNDPKWLAGMVELEGFGGTDGRYLYVWKYALSGSMYQSQVFLNRFMQEDMLSIFDLKNRTVDLHQAAKMREMLDWVRKSHSPYMLMPKIMLPVYETIPEKFAQYQSYSNEAAIACAIERFRIAHNALPATLDDLHIPALPHDIITGQPLHYRVTGPDDYILYSVGWNGTDDGGKLVKRENGTPDFKQGDLVWSLKPL